MRKGNLVKKHGGTAKKGLVMAMAAMMMVSSGAVPGVQMECVQAYTEPIDGEMYSDANKLMYRLQQDGTCTVYSAEEVTLVNVEIPSQIEKDGMTYKVVGIERNAFESCQELISVKIPDSIQYIGSNAFYECEKLNNVEIAEGVTEIASGAFCSCPKLKRLNVPASVVKLGYRSSQYEEDDFIDCICDSTCYLICPVDSVAAAYAKEKNLKYVVGNVAETGTVLTDAKNGCEVKVVKDVTNGATVSYVKSTKTSATSITIPATVKIDNVTYKVVSIADEAFLGNKKVTKIVIGKNIKTIGKKAFANCSKLKKMEVKSASLSVGAGALSGTKKALIIKVPKGNVYKFKTYFKGKGNNNATINSTGKALPKKNLKQLGVPFDLKKNKTFNIKIKLKAIGTTNRIVTVKNVKITKASKKGYKKAVVQLKWNIKLSKSEIHNVVDALLKDGTYRTGGFDYFAILDGKTGANLGIDNDYGVSTKYTSKTEDYDGCWVCFMTYTKVTIVYPEDYKDLCFGVGGELNSVSETKSAQNFFDGKVDSFTKTSLYKKSKKNCHFMQIK